MSIEEANDNLIMLKYFLQEEGDENWEKYCDAIETLLLAYEKEKEKNKELDKINYRVNKNLLETAEEIEELRNEVMEKELIIAGMKEDRRIAVEEIQEQYYISKDKIKAKIEELDKAYEDSKNEDGESEYYYPNYTIEVLQELIEKE